jgi:hypothetical protein
MARKLNTYQTSLGFFDLAVAAPSMKAALEAWGADSNLFHQGAAKQSDDPDVIAATMAAGRRSEASRRLQGGLSKSTPSCLPISPVTTFRRGQAPGRRDLSRRTILSEPRIRQLTGRRRSLSRGSRSAASANVRRKRPLSARSASGGRRPSTRRKAPWMRPVGSTKRTLRTFKLSSRSSRKDRRPKKPDGRRRKPG